MLCQATAVFVALATGLTADLDAVALLAVLGQRLSIARATKTVAVDRAIDIVTRHVGLVIDGTVVVHLGIGKGAL